MIRDSKEIGLTDLLIDCTLFFIPFENISDYFPPIGTSLHLNKPRAELKLLKQVWLKLP